MENILTDLMNYALFRQHISVIMSSEASFGAPSVAFPDTRTIIINTNIENKRQLPLQMAHEIGHVVNGDVRHQPLYFSPSGIDYPTELAANRFAVDMLIPYYLDDRDKEHVNVNEFMNIFVIPSHLEKMVRKELLEAM